MEITVDELLLIKNARIIDVRDVQKYKIQHIPGAISVDFYQLLSHPDSYLVKGDTYYLYCDLGVRSKMLVQKLNHMGYSTKSIVGGFYSYIHSIK